LADVFENSFAMTLRPLALAALVLLAGCNKPAAQSPAAANASGAPPAAAASADAASASPSPPPDLSGQPVQGTVAMAEGAATTDPKAPMPKPAAPAK
jgi:hypothetical protein